jgi:hypothetical protein
MDLEAAWAECAVSGAHFGNWTEWRDLLLGLLVVAVEEEFSLKVIANLGCGLEEITAFAG